MAVAEVLVDKQHETQTYKAKTGSGLSEDDANVIGNELEQIRHKQGEITPITVLDAARHSDSPLHGYFEWDNAVAAENHRRMQARSLVRKITVVVETTTFAYETPAFVSVVRNEDRSYTPVAMVLSDKELRENAVHDIAKWLLSRRDELELYPEFEAVLLEMNKLDVLLCVSE